MAEVIPGIAVGALVLAYSAPVPLGETLVPIFHGHMRLLVFAQAHALRIHLGIRPSSQSFCLKLVSEGFGVSDVADAILILLML